MPPLAGDLPSTMDEARALSANNPAVISAAYAQVAADSGVDAAQGALRPTVQARADVVFEKSDALVEMVWPLYDGGLSRSQLRTAKDAVQQRISDRENEERGARQQAMTAFQALQTAKASITAYETQVRSATETAAGIRRERNQGLRTIDDVLDADIEVTNAQVSLVGAQRDARVAAYQLLAAVGRLDARTLRLPVALYDPEAHYRAVRNDFWSTGPAQPAGGQGR
jgi:outer membrane protein/adhesin transport system outer membrane protein